MIVDAEWTVGPGLDTGIFSTTERDDGTLQLVAGKYPLYTFGGDAAPGDLTGQGSGDVWFAVGLDGTLLEDDAAGAATDEVASTATAATPRPRPPSRPSRPSPARRLRRPPICPGADRHAPPLGDVLVDGYGLTLYGFTKDADGTPTCEGELRRGVAAGDRRQRRVARPASTPTSSRVVQRPDGSSS